MSFSIGNAAKGLTALILVSVLAGCGKSLDPVAPLSLAKPTSDAGSDQGVVASSQLLYPLQIGNHWSYDQEATVVITPFGGSPDPPLRFSSTMDVDLVGTAQQSGRDYVVQRETTHSETSDAVYDFLYRQDFSGLFNADQIANDEVEPTSGSTAQGGSPEGTTPLLASLSADDRRAVTAALRRTAEIRRIAIHGAPSAARGRGTPGPLEGEIALLRYPLTAQAQWQVREDPLVIDTVQGMESVQLPAGRFNGWRIRIDWPAVFGPNDRVYVWYGQDGLLRLSQHVELVATDSNGEPYANVLTETEQRLTAVALVGP